MMHSPPPRNFVCSTDVCRDSVWVSNALLVWSILTLVVVVACSITVLFFRLKAVYIPCV